MIIVFTTVATSDEAEQLAQKVVEARLAACVQILPQIHSTFIWDGKVTSEREHLVMIKTLAEKFGALSDFISANHTYATPEIVAIECEKVSKKYLAWLTQSVT